MNVFIRNVLNVKPAALTIDPGSRATLRASYRQPFALNALSRSTSIASVASGPPLLGTFVVTGQSKGHTTIEIFDDLGNSFDVPVTVR